MSVINPIVVQSGGGASGGFDVAVYNGGGGNQISMEVRFAEETGNYGSIFVDFGLYNYPPNDDLSLRNVVWLKVHSYGVSWDGSSGITEAQAMAGHTLTENVFISLRD